MTPQEAKALFEEDLKGGKCNDNCPECNARELAISALEKQIPKKPIKKNPICYAKTKDGQERFAFDYFCPNCNEQIKRFEHHCKCGQALDWSDTE